LKKMIAALAVLTAVVTPLLLFVAYCRSLLASTSSVELSEHARSVTGIQDGIAPADEFARLRALAELCPARGNDENPLGAISTYYHLLTALQTLTSPASHSLADRAERERWRCSYFVAVTLDRRIAHTRQMWSEQMIHPER
jgi:hypothetical protein